jgi:hypothetical protein
MLSCFTNLYGFMVATELAQTTAMQSVMDGKVALIILKLLLENANEL